MEATGNQTEQLPRIAIIVAMTKERVIGRNNNLPWHLPEDLKLFKEITMGHPVLMGRKTFETIGQPLPGRENLVLSTQVLAHDGIHRCAHFMEALRVAAQISDTLFIIGGRELYQKALPIASELHISWVKESYNGDVYFPEMDLQNWQEYEKVDYAEFVYIRYEQR
jgi:dihydrofolate reductase